MMPVLLRKKSFGVSSDEACCGIVTAMLFLLGEPDKNDLGFKVMGADRKFNT